MTGLNIAANLDKLVSHALTLGIFERVNQHEPKNAPGNGLTAAVWVDDIGPARGQSGLSSTTARVVCVVRLYTSMLQEPQDAIDPNLVDAVDALMAAYSGDFELGGNVRCIDLLGGLGGTPLAARAGHITVDQKAYRVMTITVPLIINDAWNQEA